MMHVAWMGDMISAHKIFIWKPEQGDHLGNCSIEHGEITHSAEVIEIWK